MSEEKKPPNIIQTVFRKLGITKACPECGVWDVPLVRNEGEHCKVQKRYCECCAACKRICLAKEI